MTETRRERYRRETSAEARRRALEQLSGEGAISLNAIARDMGMSGPALYRYVGSRDDLLTELVVEAYGELGDALWAAVNSSSGQPPPDRMRAVATVYRAWAVAHPARYQLIFGTPVPGYHAPPERTMPAAERMGDAVLALFTEAGCPEAGGADPGGPGPGRRPGPGGADPVDRRFEEWAARAEQPPLPGRSYRDALAFWTRLHGVVSLELAGHFDLGLPEGALLYEAEVEALIHPYL